MLAPDEPDPIVSVKKRGREMEREPLLEVLELFSCDSEKQESSESEEREE